MRSLSYITGILFFLFISLLFYITIIQRAESEHQYPYKFKLYFSRSDGLKEGMEVSLLGTHIGVIKSISIIEIYKVQDRKNLDPHVSHAIEIVVGTTKPITLWKNYKIKFKTKTVFSSRYIEIDPGSYKNEKYQVTPDEPEFSSNISPVIIPAFKYFDDFFQSANYELKFNQKYVRSIVSDLREMTDKVNKEKSDLSLIINQNIMEKKVSETISKANIVTNEMRRYYEGNREDDTSLMPFSIVTLTRLFWGRGIFFGGN